MGFLGVFSAHCKSNLRIVVPNIVEKFIIRILLLGLILIYFYTNSFKFSFFIIGYAAIYFLVMFLVAAYFFNLNSLKSETKQGSLTATFKKELLTFGSLSFLTVIGGRVVENIDIIMLSSMLDLSAAGIYKIAFYIGNPW